jgi:phytoene dehydrogenase-like protein
MRAPDAIVVGAGPNGLAAAVTLARAGLAVDVIEGAAEPGGGCRTQELTLPGFRHDTCSAVHPLAAASPFFLGSDLGSRGLRLLHPQVAFAHPLDGSRAAVVTGSVNATASGLGADEARYRRLMDPLVRGADVIVPEVLSPLRSLPARPVPMAWFGLPGLLPVTALARAFRTDEARGLLAGAAGHSMLPLRSPLSGGFGLLLMLLAHSAGWPVAEGGSAAITTALIGELTARGGTLTTGRPVTSLNELPQANAVLLDVSPRSFAAMGGEALPVRYARSLRRYRYGPGVCKVDWALAGPVPWQAHACRQAGTLHVGGTFEEIAASESAVAAGRHPDRPYCLVTQPCVVDPTRAPAGKHTLWAYCHVPSGSGVDMTDRIEAQIERFAPGFRDLILARSVMTAADMERHDPNYVGGDINCGASTVRQIVFRPVAKWNPYRTPLPGVYLCSAATPPGGGVHGMCGAGAASAALADLARCPASRASWPGPVVS